jgi:hypothetical protein
MLNLSFRYPEIITRQRRRGGHRPAPIIQPYLPSAGNPPHPFRQAQVAGVSGKPHKPASAAFRQCQSAAQHNADGLPLGLRG